MKLITACGPYPFLGQLFKVLAVFTVPLLFELPPVTHAQKEVPALGRHANLGYLYGEVRGNPLINVFKQENIPSEFRDELQTPQETIETGITNSYADAFSLLDIDSNTAVNILAGAIKPRGSAAILKEISKNPNDVTGTLWYRYQTVAQSLVYNEGLKEYVNMQVIRHLNATHVVTGVIWGTTVAVSFQKSPTSNLTRETITDYLKNYLKSFNLPFSPPFELENEFNFTITVKSDIALPSGFQETFSDVRKLLKEVPELVKGINEGKGVPLEYTVTPLAEFKNYLKLQTPNLADSKFLKTRLRDFTLKRFISIFDDFAVSEQAVSELWLKLYSHVSCLTEKSREEIDALHSGVAESQDLLREALYNSLYEIRSGSEPVSTLSHLLQEYAQGNFSLKAVESKLKELNKLVTKIEFGQQVKELYPNVKYFGSDGDLVSVINQNFDKNVYILFTKTEFSKNDPIKYAEKLQLFLRSLNTNDNSLVILDCDFHHIACQNLTETTIQKYSNGQLTGPLFEVAIDACAGSQNPCMNSGKCADDVDGFSCACQPQWFGKRCQHELDPCQNHGCLNNATCTPSSNYWDHSCNCSAGFTGQSCEINIDDCATNGRTCLNGGTCVDGTNRFTCTCPPGYAGDLCEVLLPPPTCTALEKAARNTLPVVTVGCGGLINMPGLQSLGSFLVDFKSSSLYKKEEQCLWTFDNVKDGKNYWLNVTVTLLCEGFLNSNSSLSVVDWKHIDDWMPAQHRLTHKGHIYQTLPISGKNTDRKLFLRFTSRDALGSGFLVLVNILGANSWHNGSNFVHTVSPGSAAYVPFVASSYTSVVVSPQQQQPLTLSIDYFEYTKFNTAALLDALDIYEIPPTNPPRRLQRFGQNLTSPASFSSEFPILATMFTWNATAGKGFRLTWK